MSTSAPLSLLHAFNDAVDRDPSGIAARTCVQDTWVDHTWSALDADVRRTSAALHTAGVAHGDRVAIMAPTSLQWVVLELAIFSVGAVVVPIYPTSGLGDVEHVLNVVLVPHYQVKEVARCLIHTILFNRALGPLKPREQYCELFDICFAKIVKIFKTIDFNNRSMNACRACGNTVSKSDAI
jgi:acyl-CoA synthetase (AMP-forming)/AMP-acid ligase II